MPGRDRTGPTGQGPKTGRVMGYCSGGDSPDYTTGVPAATGRGAGRRSGAGMGRGAGRGSGRGFRCRGVHGSGRAAE